MTEQEALQKLNEARDEIKRRVKCTEMLVKAKKGGYICPVCRSGEGPHGTGAVKYYPDTNTWACHACEQSPGKHTGGDVIKLYELTFDTNHTEALKALGQTAGVDVETPLKEYGRAKNGRPEARSITPPPPKVADYSQYYAESRGRLPMAGEYLASRGISLKTAAAYGLGFDPQADTAGTGHPCPRLIIPVTKSHYVARRTDGGQDFKKLNPKGSTPGIFNAAIIKGDRKEIFVTEGALDALSVIEAGADAVGLNSVGNAGKLVELLEKQRPAAAFILCLDNDEPGRKATETLREGLTRLNIPFAVADICGDAKDPNEALCKDKALFLSAIDKAKKLVTTKPDNTALYIDLFMGSDIEKFKKDIPTGFEELDLMAGGLYPGLYVLAAISSLGKTTFALQMAEQIAGAGHDVIFFSLEQSRFEMVAKGISRRTAQKDMSKAVTALSIRKGYVPAHVQEAAEQYKADVGDRLSIVEGNFACDIAYIADYIRRYVASNGVRPVVFVDYLQILQPTETRQNTKETVDNAVTELKRLSREINIPIIAISSVNRVNYLTPIDFESFKESGGIEYTADVAWGLQLQCLNDKSLFEKEGKATQKREAVKKAKKANPRKIELVCLKNRYGTPSFSCYFDYYAAYDLMTKCTKLDFEQEYETPKAGRTI